MSEGNIETREQGAARPQIRAVLQVRDDVKGEWRDIESRAGELLEMEPDNWASGVAAEFGDKARYYKARAEKFPQAAAAPGGGLADDGA